MRRYKPGDKLGRLVLRERVGRAKGSSIWTAKCRCGNVKTYLLSNITHGTTTSCGCARREDLVRRSYKHGHSHSPTYRSWYAMIQRCRKDLNYVSRRITVCRRWEVFSNFLADMGVRPAGKTLDRRKNGRGYWPTNCRWATPAEQNRNTRHNVMLTLDGRTMCAADWAKELGLCPKTLRQRLYRGWPLRQVLTPKRSRHDCETLAGRIFGRGRWFS